MLGGAEVRREMLLLLKVNEFLREVDKKIGNPVDNMSILVGY